MNANLLVSSSSRKAPLVAVSQDAIEKATGGHVIAGDSDLSVRHLSLAKDFWQMPRTSDENFDEIVSGCHDRGIAFVLPSRDSELRFWASREKDFEKEGIKVIISNTDAINLCRDKLKFYEDLKSQDDLSLILTTLAPEIIDSNSLVVKERFGSGSKSILLNVSASDAREMARDFEEPIFQPFLRGREISVDAHFRRDGELLGFIMRDRVVVVDGESQITRSFSSREIEKSIGSFLSPLGLSHGFFGPIVLQAIVSEEGEVSVLEINPRFGGASTLSVAMGLKTVYWSLVELANGSQGDEFQPFKRPERDLELRRYVCDSFVEV